jgi:hypothetical protein
MKRNTLLICLLLLPVVVSSLPAQSGPTTYQFKPDYTKNKKWLVDYQSQYSCRFRVEAQGEVVSNRQFNIVENRKYVKEFLSTENGHPTTIEHFYLEANRQKQTEQGSSSRNQLPEQGARVQFTWNPDSESYDIAESSHELGDETHNRLRPHELFNVILPEEPVHIGSEPWTPELERPVSLSFGSNSDEDEIMVPEFKRFICELSNVREEEGSTIALISVLLSTGESAKNAEDQIYSRLEGELEYDLTEQKPISFSITSRPAGISFKRQVEDTTVYVENMGIFISANYNSSIPSDVKSTMSSGDSSSKNGSDSNEN